MKSIETSIRIKASGKQVWESLMDFKNYPHWNPFITSISGKQKVGEQLKVTIQPEGMKFQVFQPTILVIKKEVEFRWLGHLLVKGLFDGVHYFKIKENTENTTLIHGEHFTGIFSGVLYNLVGDKTRRGFEAMNIALKDQLENNTTIANSSQTINRNQP
ncbi:MAG: SRPBCC domain-containing protein [Bacteroidota bacterium]